MSSLAARRRRSVDFWPGFVDALSALLMVLVFLLLIFTIGQFALSDALSGRDKALAQLNAELAELAKTLALETSAKQAALTRAEELSVSLASTQGERDGLQISLDETQSSLTQTAAQLESSEAERNKAITDLNALNELKKQLESEIAAKLAQLSDQQKKLVEQTELSAKSAAQVELLNRQVAALRAQLKELSSALELANAKSQAKDVQIEDLGKQLNLALANKVNQLQQYRSDFFGKLKEALGNRPDIRIVGDRFVVSSELLFASGTDELTEAARGQLDQLAFTLNEVTNSIPGDIDWVLRIDGHTDKRPIRTARFPSNWELSSARAIAIVKHLVISGIPPRRLAANGFGEFQPLATGEDEGSYALNRRIEIQLTNR